MGSKFLLGLAKVQHISVLLLVFLIGFLAVFVFPGNLRGDWAGGGGARMQFGGGYQDFSQCNGTIMYVDAQGQERTLYQHPDVPAGGH